MTRNDIDAFVRCFDQIVEVPVWHIKNMLDQIVRIRVTTILTASKSEVRLPVLASNVTDICPIR